MTHTHTQTADTARVVNRQHSATSSDLKTHSEQYASSTYIQTYTSSAITPRHSTSISFHLRIPAYNGKHLFHFGAKMYENTQNLLKYC